MPAQTGAGASGGPNGALAKQNGGQQAKQCAWPAGLHQSQQLATQTGLAATNGHQGKQNGLQLAEDEEPADELDEPEVEEPEVEEDEQQEEEEEQEEAGPVQPPTDERLGLGKPGRMGVAGGSAFGQAKGAGPGEQQQQYEQYAHSAYQQQSCGAGGAHHAHPQHAGPVFARQQHQVHAHHYQSQTQQQQGQQGQQQQGQQQHSAPSNCYDFNPLEQHPPAPNYGPHHAHPLVQHHPQSQFAGAQRAFAHEQAGPPLVVLHHAHAHTQHPPFGTAGAQQHPFLETGGLQPGGQHTPESSPSRASPYSSSLSGSGSASSKNYGPAFGSPRTPAGPPPQSVYASAHELHPHYSTPQQQHYAGHAYAGQQQAAARSPHTLSNGYSPAQQPHSHAYPQPHLHPHNPQHHQLHTHYQHNPYNLPHTTLGHASSTSAPMHSHAHPGQQPVGGQQSQNQSQSHGHSVGHNQGNSQLQGQHHASPSQQQQFGVGDSYAGSPASSAAINLSNGAQASYSAGSSAGSPASNPSYSAGLDLALHFGQPGPFQQHYHEQHAQSQSLAQSQSQSQAQSHAQSHAQSQAHALSQAHAQANFDAFHRLHGGQTEAAGQQQLYELQPAHEAAKQEHHQQTCAQQQQQQQQQTDDKYHDISVSPRSIGGHHQHQQQQQQHQSQQQNQHQSQSQGQNQSQQQLRAHQTSVPLASSPSDSKTASGHRLRQQHSPKSGAQEQCGQAQGSPLEHANVGPLALNLRQQQQNRPVVTEANQSGANRSPIMERQQLANEHEGAAMKQEPAANELANLQLQLAASEQTGDQLHFNANAYHHNHNHNHNLQQQQLNNLANHNHNNHNNHNNLQQQQFSYADSRQPQQQQQVLTTNMVLNLDHSQPQTRALQDYAISSAAQMIDSSYSPAAAVAENKQLMHTSNLLAQPTYQLDQNQLYKSFPTPEMSPHDPSEKGHPLSTSTGSTTTSDTSHTTANQQPSQVSSAVDQLIANFGDQSSVLRSVQPPYKYRMIVSTSVANSMSDQSIQRELVRPSSEEQPMGANHHGPHSNKSAHHQQPQAPAQQQQSQQQTHDQLAFETHGGQPTTEEDHQAGDEASPPS